MRTKSEKKAIKVNTIFPIIKAEFDYHKFSTLLTLIIILSLVMGILGWGWTGIRPDIHGIFTIMVVATVVLWFVRLIRIIKDKLDRRLATLPIANRKIAIARILIIDIFWIAVFILFWLLFFILRPQEFQFQIIWYSISITGLLVAFNAYPFIHRDLLYYFVGKFQKIILTSIYIAIMLFVIFIFSFSAIQSYFPEISMDAVQSTRAPFAALIWTPAGAFFFLLLGAVVSYLSSIVFQKRKHYLE